MDRSKNSRLDKLFAILNSKNSILRSRALSQISAALFADSTDIFEWQHSIEKCLNFIGHKNSAHLRNSAAELLAVLFYGDHKFLGSCVPLDVKSCDDLMKFEVSQHFYWFEGFTGLNLLPSQWPFNLDTILRENSPLFACGQSEFSTKNAAALPDKARNRAQVNRHLGVDSKFDMDSASWIADDDISTSACRSNSLSPVSENQECNLPTPNMRLALIQILCITSRGHPEWQRRQGALNALLAILAKFQNIRKINSDLGNALLPAQLLKMLAHTSLCVLSLDRFADFTGSTSVAPVREIAAQVLASVVNLQIDFETKIDLKCEPVDVNIIDGCLSAIVQLCNHSKSWEIRTAGCVATKYLVPVLASKSWRLVPELCRTLIQCARDGSDEVCAAACDALAAFTLSVDILLIEQCDTHCLNARMDMQQMSMQKLTLCPAGEFPLILSFLQNAQSEAILHELSITSHLSQLLERSAGTEESAAAIGLLKFAQKLQTDIKIGSEEFCRSLMCVSKLLGHEDGLVRQAALGFIRGHSCSVTKATWRQIPDDVILNFVTTLCKLILFEPVDSFVFASNGAEIVLTLFGSLPILEIASGLMDRMDALFACIMVADDAPVIDPACFLRAFPSLGNEPKSLASIQICSDSISALPVNERSEIVTRRRILLAKFLALMCDAVWEHDSFEQRNAINGIFAFHLDSSAAIQRNTAALILAHCDKTNDVLKVILTSNLSKTPPPFAESTLRLAETTNSATQFIEHCNSLLPDGQFSCASTKTDDLVTKCAEICDRAVRGLRERGLHQAANSLSARWKSTEERINWLLSEAGSIRRRISLLVSGALIRWHHLPNKLNPIISPLMEAIKNEKTDAYLDIACAALYNLVKLVQNRDPCPTGKIVKNLATLAVMGLVKGNRFSTGNDKEFVISLHEIDFYSNLDDVTSMQTKNSTAALRFLVQKCGPELLEQCQIFSSYLDLNIPEKFDGDLERQVSLACLNLTRISIENLHRSLFTTERVQSWCSACLKVILDQNDDWKSAKNVHRFLACNVLIEIARRDPILFLNFCAKSLVENCRSIHLSTRLGVAEILYQLFTSKISSDNLGTFVAAKTKSISVFLPGTMALIADQNAEIRQMSNDTLGCLVRLAGLEENVDFSGKVEAMENDDTPSLSTEVRTLKKHAANFQTLLQNPGNLPKLDLKNSCLKPGVILRNYQIEGITWLWFLKEYGLHGILADDMGLGKTIQTLCVLAASQKHVSQSDKIPSLIVCPKTLVHLWRDEILKHFAVEKFLTPVALQRFDESLVVNGCVYITSYEVLRKFADSFAQIQWHYCILDEGHVIRNRTTKMFAAACGIKARHRLVLTGTPVQNSVADLWSIFAFLMPCYLGDWASFNKNFAKPISASQDVKVKSTEADVGSKCLGNLHKMILPFTMRRLKSEVLRDLPPKIIQERYCTLSESQKTLYIKATQGFSSQLKKSSDDKTGSRVNAMQLFIYLRKLCDHPCLVSDAGDSIEESGKMLALGELLRECGIAPDVDGASDSNSEQNLLNEGHRALIFCQFRCVVDLIAKLFDVGAFGPPGSINYLRLDGSVPVADRQQVANRFNADNDVQVLLLTTQVGGLGLTLTGADTIIFIDSDWNPARDSQAIDRAHRIGQTKVLTVYRLLSRGTVEENVFRVQNWKRGVGQALVGDANQSLHSMATDQLLELMTLNSNDDDNFDNNEHAEKVSSESAKCRENKTQPKRVKIDRNLADNFDVAEMWESAAEYESDFDVQKFAQNLGLNV